MDALIKGKDLSRTEVRDLFREVLLNQQPDLQQGAFLAAITAKGALSVRAHTDAQQIWADQDLTVQSTTDEIRIQASRSITLTAGQSQIELKGGDITFTCPGTWTVKGAMHEWGAGGGGGGASLMALPDSRAKLFDEQIRAISKATGQPIAGQAYLARMPDQG